MNSTSEILNKKGYLVRRQAIDRQVIQEMHDYLAARLDRLREMFREWSGGEIVKSAEDYRDRSNKIAEYKTKGLPKDLRHFLRGEYDLETRLSNEIRQFASNPNLREILAEALGEKDYFLHYPPMLRFKIPHADRAFVPPHQDRAYSNHIETFVAAWIPLTPITDEVGGVTFYEGTQELGKLTHGQSGSWESKAFFDESKYATSSPKMELGDVLFFTPTIVHESGLNISDDIIRFSIDMRGFSKKVKSSKAYYDPWSGEVYQN